MNEVKPEDRCSIPDEVLRSLIKRELEVLRRRGLILAVDPMVNEAIQPDGGLYSDSRYLIWNPGDKVAGLDGEYTADELRAIADHMDHVNAERKEG